MRSRRRKQPRYDDLLALRGTNDMSCRNSDDFVEVSLDDFDDEDKKKNDHKFGAENVFDIFDTWM